jgi:hypothetical protein
LHRFFCLRPRTGWLIDTEYNDSCVHKLDARPPWPVSVSFRICIQISVTETVLLFFSNSWEWATSLGFDWQFISGQKRFRWPLVNSRPNYPSPMNVNAQSPPPLPRRYSTGLADTPFCSRSLGCTYAIIVSNTIEVDYSSFFAEQSR